MFKKPGWQTTLAVAAIAAGFAAMGVAWNGAASVDYIQGQLPYLISGGFIGLALVGVGIGLMAFESARRSRRKLEDRFEELAQGLVDAVAYSNGHGEAEAVNGKGKVVLGATSYHRPTCRLVKGKESPIYAAVEAAAQQGLTPCRVCNPTQLDKASTGA